MKWSWCFVHQELFENHKGFVQTADQNLTFGLSRLNPEWFLTVWTAKKPTWNQIFAIRSKPHLVDIWNPLYHVLSSGRASWRALYLTLCQVSVLSQYRHQALKIQRQSDKHMQFIVTQHMIVHVMVLVLPPFRNIFDSVYLVDCFLFLELLLLE